MLDSAGHRLPLGHRVCLDDGGVSGHFVNEPELKSPSSALVHFGWQNADVRQVAVVLGIIHTVADNELVRDLESDVIGMNRLDVPCRLVQQRRYFQRSWLVR